jgi:hypothetical protein
MSKEKTYKKNRFFLHWTLLSFGIIPLSYIISLVVVLMIHGAFGYDQTESGTFLSQTIAQLAGGAIIGLGTGIYQKSMLERFFKVPQSWIYTLVIGFAVIELIVCIFLWQLGIYRSDLRFIESNPIPESMFFAGAGLIVGILQWTILRKFFSGSIYWILTSTIGWGVCILITQFSIWAFFLGSLLYGLITGATLTLFTRPSIDKTMPGTSV